MVEAMDNDIGTMNFVSVVAKLITITKILITIRSGSKKKKYNEKKKDGRNKKHIENVYH